jgi:orotidine-5'-phosphate decarboxylase
MTNKDGSGNNFPPSVDDVTSTQSNSCLIVPLDFPDLATALAMVDQLDTTISWFKVGKELFTSVGPLAVESLRDRGKQVFLDLKFYDIPNTVAGAVAAATAVGANLTNVHASGGLEMMKAAKQSATRQAEELGIPRPKLLGVTVLTSIDQTTFVRDFDSRRKVAEQVVYLAELSQQAGMDGVVASPLEIEQIRQACGREFWIVTPGVRPGGRLSCGKDALNDQKRVMTPRQAIVAGANQLVVGRPITQTEDPVQAANQILAEISAAGGVFPDPSSG